MKNRRNHQKFSEVYSRAECKMNFGHDSNKYTQEKKNYIPISASGTQTNIKKYGTQTNIKKYK